MPVSEDELHAFVDGELPEDRRADVEAWLVAHPADAARVAAWRKQIELINERYAAVADEPVPQRLTIERLAQPARWRRLVTAAAAIVLVIAGGAAGWFARGAWDGTPAAVSVTAEALEAHRVYVVEVRHPVEVPGSEAAHLQQWLSRRVGHELRAPNLADFGLTLVGGRLLPGPKGAAAAFFMYEGRSGERFTIYCVRSRSPESALRYRDAGTVGAVYWADGDLSYVVSGPAERQRLHGVAQSAYEQLETRARRERSS